MCGQRDVRPASAPALWRPDLRPGRREWEGRGGGRRGAARVQAAGLQGHPHGARHARRPGGQAAGLHPGRHDAGAAAGMDRAHHARRARHAQRARPHPPGHDRHRQHAGADGRGAGPRDGAVDVWGDWPHAHPGGAAPGRVHGAVWLRTGLCCRGPGGHGRRGGHDGSPAPRRADPGRTDDAGHGTHGAGRRGAGQYSQCSGDPRRLHHHRPPDHGGRQDSVHDGPHHPGGHAAGLLPVRFKGRGIEKVAGLCT